MRTGLTISLVAHSATLVAVLLCFPLHQSSTQVIPVSVATIGDDGNPGFQVSTHPEHGFGRGSVIIKGKPTVSPSQPDAPQTMVVAKLTKASPTDSPSSLSRAPPSVANNPTPADREAEVEQRIPSSVVGQTPSERNLWNTGEVSPAHGGVETGFAEKPSNEPASLTITRRANWEGNAVDDNKLTYSVPGSSFKLTMREVYSGSFARPTFTPGFGMQGDEMSGIFGLTPAPWGSSATARSQKLDWTLVNQKNFGVTAFGYQNEVGSTFKPFGQTKNEFATAGSTAMKAGGAVRVGAFSFGFVQSTREQLAWSGFQGVETGANLASVQQEASVTLNLANLASNEGSGFFTKLLPTLWASTSTGHATSQEAVPSDIISNSFGGTWAWDTGQMNLGYWSYASSEVAGSAWSGQGVDASVGLYYSSFGIDADFSYGNSADVAPSWQSAGALYGSSVTISYTPEKLPGISVSAAAGNYDQSGISFGGTSVVSDIYKVSSNGEYWSIGAGLDLTRLFWTPAAEATTGQLSSVKLLYRYSDSLYSDNSAGPTRDVSSLAAVIIQRTF